MAPVALFIVAVLAHLVILQSAEYPGEEPAKHCPGHFCSETVGHISFPFKSPGDPRECGLFTVDCSEHDQPKIQLKEGGYWHEFEGFLLKTWIWIKDRDLIGRLEKDRCDDGVFEDLSLPNASSIPEVSLSTLNLTLIKCDNILGQKFYPQPKDGCRNAYHTYYINSSNSNLPNPLPPRCETIQVPMRPSQPNMSSSLRAEFSLKVEAYKCYQCIKSKGECLVLEGKFKCAKGDKPSKLKLGLGIGLGFPALLAICGFLLLLYKKKRSSLFLSRNISSQPHTNSDIEGGGAYCGVPVFSYSELDEATNHFDSENELGDGGFGTVYYGKLKDGREVAVKRLYEHNYKRVEQFLNEIEILTRLRHRNLVTLYGCTSRRSRGLLLVYEYISNGTVADHLHGDRADPGSLTWPIRMSIAIETANALSYLHASEIVHRDVKTNNILLDDNFCVKVADFGLSRLFPFDVTHVSTAPQGTPGYVDPEYHQCYQLTSKSDVYSFGVVLIELISSLPAVDIMRHRHEINLANLAISKIQKGLFNELVDQRLGFESDGEVRRMIIAVAELAFQCLQQDNNVRPTMNEVLEALKMIESGSYVPENLKPELDSESVKTSVQPPASPDGDEIGLLNMRPPHSPVSVTQKWPSTRSTSPNASA
ncbi:serine/threonine-protein kinase [Pyrus ussuriensis x Pyrus communis]|uniref:Serine/threonine-protein kinase n=1 Tax=Pyrus ussuriensis x Pyrus communis TaxID=2448454 RepID=A0A5N5H4U3_9ROSA|nr:serine/threonine-protein kinase [Pyrus ussuriensis x Pyrus communis]